jgi:hypothetical protein
MNKEKIENNQSDIKNQDLNIPDNALILQFRDSIVWGCIIFLIIFFSFLAFLVFSKRDLIIQVLSVFEIPNLVILIGNFVQDYGLPALVTILIAIITGIYLYFRFFSNIHRNDFSDDMGNYLRFYETLFSTVFDVTILAILFLYLIFVKHSFWEIIVVILLVVGIGISINKITVPYLKIVKDYSAIESMNLFLDHNESNSKRAIFSDKESLWNFIFYHYTRTKSVWITTALFLTLAIVILGIAGGYNILTIILLELILIKYALFLSQIGSLPQIPVNLYLTNQEIAKRVFVIRETLDFISVLSYNDCTFVIMKSQLIKIEPIIEPKN